MERTDSSTADAFALLESLMPIIGVQADDRRSKAAPMRVSMYLGALAQALELQIRASGQGLAGMRAAEERDTVSLLDEAPVLGPGSACILCLIARYWSPHPFWYAAP
jgi:hypothetical protein